MFCSPSSSFQTSFVDSRNHVKSNELVFFFVVAMLLFVFRLTHYSAVKLSGNQIAVKCNFGSRNERKRKCMHVFSLRVGLIDCNGN